MASSDRLTILNVPSDIGSMIKGKSLAPEAFRTVELASKLRKVGYEVTEVDALSKPRVWSSSASFEPNGVRNEAENVQVCHEVKDVVAKVLREDDGGFLLVIGGECNIAPAIMSAYWHHFSPQRKRVGLIYIDADADLTVPSEVCSSGNLASMKLTHLTMRPGAL